MKVSITSAIILVCLASTSAWAMARLAARRSSRQRAQASGPEAYRTLRKMALGMTPRALGLKPAPGATEPYGVLMETGYPEAVATLTSFASGDAGLYFSTGGGVIGGIGHETVRAAARRFVAASRDFLPVMTKTSAHPLPPAGRTRFYVLTPSGTFTTETRESDLGMRHSSLSPLFYHGQEVITELRLVTEKRGG